MWCFFIISIVRVFDHKSRVFKIFGFLSITRAWRRLYLDLARTLEGGTDGLSTFNRFVTARAGLATARARLGFCHIYFCCKLTARAGLATARARLGLIMGSVYWKMRSIITKKKITGVVYFWCRIF